MNGKKRKIQEKTEILDEDFLNALNIEIQKKYPNNTNTFNHEKTETVEVLDTEKSTKKKTKNKNKKIEILEEEPEKTLNQNKKSEATIEILNDSLNELEKTAKNLENTIEILPDSILNESKSKKETIEILTDKLDTLVKASQKLENTIELLKFDLTKNDEKNEQIEILNEQLEELANPENLENTIKFFKINASEREDIEFLEEEIQTFKDPSTNLENTIELLDIVKKEEPIQVKNKIKPKKKPWIILLCICILIISFLIYKAFFWQRDSMITNKQIENIVKNTKTKESIIKKENILGATTEEDDRYFNYLDVDFEELIKQNDEVEGWIKVNNTNINYPFVQTKDNNYYLKHSFDKSYNTAGWVFADFRNNLEQFDQNTILYAHGRLDNTMFGSLKQVIEKNWYENMENEFLQISTRNSNSIWQVFSVYTIEPETYYITPSFETDEEYQKFLETLTKRSVHNFQVKIGTKDKILTLSSCYNDTLRIVLHAKLVNIEQKEK